ncbi:leucine carboxyl methyltransferase 1-like [Mya arenaria]|uniref:leucine carboxyl methyltransferase 1-like n=1 Tax=Mya arenaria TaxID=6604 RepID=UPI0022E6D60B|nr:leucine carboxyl methyltransferase 1-like [Mya arenaria]
MSSEEGVRATNDDAAQCKRYAVDKGYWQDPYIKLFTSRGQQNHAPEISIGYYARVKGLRMILEKFLTVTDGKCQIVSIGAGFDTLFWNLKDAGINVTSFIEVDFSAVTSRKIHSIRRSQVLLQKITNEDEEIRFSTTDLHGKDYHLVAANLKNLKDFNKKLGECGIDKTLPTIFIAECVLVYIEKDCTDALLKWTVDNFSTVFFVNYEQVNMGDKFGEVMMENLRSRECMLHTEYCASIDTQIQRMSSQGFEGADAMEMRHVLYRLPQNDVMRIQRIEFLDEQELLEQLMSHYCYCWAYKDPNKIGLGDIGL